MATKRRNRTSFVVQTENGTRRLFWIAQTNRRELIVSPRGAISIFPDRGGLPNYNAQPESLEHRKLTIHLPALGAPLSCISLETTKENKNFQKSVIPTSAIVDGGYALVYAYFGGTLNHQKHKSDDRDGRHINLATYDQNESSLFYAIFATRIDICSEILPPSENFNLHVVEFECLKIVVASVVVPVPSIARGIAFFCRRCAQNYFNENENTRPDSPINSFSAFDAGLFCVQQAIIMPSIVFS